MTNEQARRVIEAIEECNRFIDKEEPRNPELRPIETQKLLEFYYRHRANLQQRLSA